MKNLWARSFLLCTALAALCLLLFQSFEKPAAAAVKHKQYLHIIVQPGYTFTYSPEAGYQGLVTGRPIFIAYARGGQYPPGTPGEAFDLQTKYVELIFQFMGFTDIRSLIVEPTLEQGPEVAQAKRQAALAQARDMAREF